jgi:putative ABC transport system permease protein
VDLRTSQALLSLDDTRSADVSLSAAESEVLGTVTEDSLFGDDGLFGGSTDALFTEIENVSMDELNSELSETLQRDEQTASVFVPQYHFAVVLLDNPDQLLETQAALTQWASENNLDWNIGDWENAAGFIGNMANSIKIVLNGMVMVIAFVSTLIIMNTLVISVTERLQEIGTMRAIGAQKMFVRKMILAETLILAVSSSLIGVAISATILGIVNVNGIAASNDFLMVLFGGDALFPSLSSGAVIQAVGMMTLGALIACLYPLGIALKVSPLKAMQG